MPNTTTVTNISQFSVAVLSTLFSIIMWTIQHLILCEVASVLPRIALRQSPLTMQDYHCGQQHGSLSLSPPPFLCPQTVKPSVYRPATLCLLCSLFPLALVNVHTVCTSTCLHLVLAPSMSLTFTLSHAYLI